jgi:response regulator RpfG family c-di-GMP phosphodiesterase
MSDDDILIFAEEPTEIKNITHGEPWKIIIADDEEEIHAVTQMVLEDVIFENRNIKFFNAYSGEETIKLISENPDVAIILLDVVMETDDAGLKAAKFIRDELLNTRVRIILRTGQPGHAPERKVITEYDINDYKEKTELTAQKLYTTILSSLRSYRDLNIIEKNRKNLESIINNSGILFENQSMESFSLNVLRQFSQLISANKVGTKKYSGFTLSITDSSTEIINGIENFKNYKEIGYENIDHLAKERINKGIKEKDIVIGNNYITACYKSEVELGAEFAVYFSSEEDFDYIDKNVLQIFSNNVLAAYSNIMLNKEIIETQKEIVLTLGEVVETRSKETAFHVKRVAELSKFIASKIGLNDELCELIRMASPMHDVGKIGIPDAILNKPAKLTPEEYDFIKKHTIIGHEILKPSNRKILQTAAVIALEHHEWWDGSGYPRKISGSDIHIFSRITALVDVFDALMHKRSYKEAWELGKVCEFIKSGSGVQFDPLLVSVFLKI